MNIVYLLGALNRGGIEMLALDIFKEINCQDINLICIHRKYGLLYDEFKETRIPLNYFGKKITYIFRFRKLIKRNNIDIIHVHLLLDAIFAFVSTFRMRKSIIFTLHSHGIKDSQITRIFRSFIMNRTTLNLFVSSSLMEYYKNKFAEIDYSTQRVLYNGVNFNKINQGITTKVSTLKNEFSLFPHYLMMGMVGSFTSVRDQMTICKFLNLLNKSKKDFYFFFVGGKANKEEELFQNCINYCKENGLENKIYFLGVRKDVPNILRQLDLFVYSSDHDTFGIAIIEAMYIGVPVLVNDWAVMREITEDGKLATLYKTKNEQDLLNKFIDYLNNKDKYIQKAIKASNCVKKKYSIETHITNLRNIYKSVIEYK